MPNHSSEPAPPLAAAIAEILASVDAVLAVPDENDAQKYNTLHDYHLSTFGFGGFTHDEVRVCMRAILANVPASEVFSILAETRNYQRALAQYEHDRLIEKNRWATETCTGAMECAS